MAKIQTAVFVNKASEVLHVCLAHTDEALLKQVKEDCVTYFDWDYNSAMTMEQLSGWLDGCDVDLTITVAELA